MALQAVEKEKVSCRGKVVTIQCKVEALSWKLALLWSSPYEVISVASHGAIGVKSSKRREFKVNEQRLKPYIDDPSHAMMVNEDLN